MRPSARSSPNRPVISSALAGIDAGQRLVEQQHRAVLHERAGKQSAPALASRQLAEGGAGAVGEAHARQRRSGRLALRRAAAAATSARRASVPISATSSALTGKSSRVRSVWAR